MTKPERIQKWLLALRSGDFKQCRDVLHDGDGYCCLGVGEVVMNRTKHRKRVHDRYRAIQLYFGYAPKYEAALIDKNDDRKWNFRRIADYIEKKILPSLDK